MLAEERREIERVVAVAEQKPKEKQNVEGIEPTNNTAERALHPAVIYRKLSFGLQSDSGSRYLERILTVSETCRLQNRNAYEYLIQSLASLFNGAKPPSLLPQ